MPPPGIEPRAPACKTSAALRNGNQLMMGSAKGKLQKKCGHLNRKALSRGRYPNTIRGKILTILYLINTLPYFIYFLNQKQQFPLYLFFRNKNCSQQKRMPATKSAANKVNSISQQQESNLLLLLLKSAKKLLLLMFLKRSPAANTLIKSELVLNVVIAKLKCPTPIILQKRVKLGITLKKSNFNLQKRKQDRVLL